MPHIWTQKKDGLFSTERTVSNTSSLRRVSYINLHWRMEQILETCQSWMTMIITKEISQDPGFNYTAYIWQSGDAFDWFTSLPTTSWVVLYTRVQSGSFLLSQHRLGTAHSGFLFTCEEKKCCPKTSVICDTYNISFFCWSVLVRQLVQFNLKIDTIYSF